MAKSLNQVQLIGNLGADPEYRQLDSGVSTARFRVATSSSWKNKEGGMEEETQWHSCITWKGLADVCGKYLKKGSKVYVNGALQTRKYTGKDGTEKYATEVRVSEMIMLSEKGQESFSGGGGGGFSAPSAPASLPEQDNDDLPF